MTEKQQAVLKIAGLIAVAGLMGLALYFMIFGGGPSIKPVATPDAPGTTGSGLPTAGSSTPGGTTGGGTTPNGPGVLTPSPVADGGVTQTTRLTSAGVLEPTITNGGTLAYYDPKDGKFYTIDAQGNVILLSQGSFPFASGITFSDGATSAVIEFPDGSNVVYDFNTGKQSTLPSHWEDFSFSSDSSSIAAKSVGTDPSNRSLVISSADGSSAKAIAPLGDNANLVNVSWSPDGDVVGFSKTGSSGNAFGQNEVYLIGDDGQAAGVLIVNGSNFKNIWAPDGNNLLYSVADGGDEYRASLWYADSQGDRAGNTRVRLSIKTTADKCVFASNTLAYCAVPLDMPAGGGTTSSLITSPDNLFSVSLPSGRSTLVAIPDQETKMTNLTVSADGKQLFYSDTVGRLNYIQLK